MAASLDGFIAIERIPKRRRQSALRGPTRGWLTNAEADKGAVPEPAEEHRRHQQSRRSRLRRHDRRVECFVHAEGRRIESSEDFVIFANPGSRRAKGRRSPSARQVLRAPLIRQANLSQEGLETRFAVQRLERRVDRQIQDEPAQLGCTFQPGQCLLPLSKSHANRRHIDRERRLRAGTIARVHAGFERVQDLRRLGRTTSQAVDVTDSSEAVEAATARSGANARGPRCRRVVLAPLLLVGQGTQPERGRVRRVRA